MRDWGKTQGEDVCKLTTVENISVEEVESNSG